MQDKEMTPTDGVKVEEAAVSEVKVEQEGQLKQPSPPPQGPTALCVGTGQATGIEGAGQSPEGQRHASGNSQGSGGQQGKRAGGNRRWEGGMRMGDDIVTLFPRRKAGQTRPGGGRGPVVLTLELLQQFYGMPLHVAAKQLGICQTAIKKVCRKLGIKKWPYKEMRLPGTKDDSVPSSPTSDDIVSTCGSENLQGGNDMPVDFASTLRKGGKAGKGSSGTSSEQKEVLLAAPIVKSDDDMDFAVRALLSLQSNKLVAAC